MTIPDSFTEFFKTDVAVENQMVAFENDMETDYLLAIKREDTLHNVISGNKFRKLKHLLQDAMSLGKSSLLTFGGAFSNHIAAVAAAGKQFGFSTTGIIRGDELEKEQLNPTLSYAVGCGMKLHFVSRAAYKDTNHIESHLPTLGSLAKYYVIPEGGHSALAVKGCAEILTKTDVDFDYICVSVGTGGTMAGILNAAKPHQKVIGYSALKGTFQEETIKEFSRNRNYEITDTYCFGGYAKIDSELIRFMNTFKEQNNLTLDPVYTAKMMYGICDMLRLGYFRENSRILAIHTGGLQGIEGMNNLLKKKKLPQILL